MNLLKLQEENLDYWDIARKKALLNLEITVDQYIEDINNIEMLKELVQYKINKIV